LSILEATKAVFAQSILKQKPPQTFFKKHDTSEKICLGFPMNSSIKFCLNFASNEGCETPQHLQNDSLE